MAILAHLEPMERPRSWRGDTGAPRHRGSHAWLERLSRWGLVVRGIIYFVPGVSAVQWAMGHHGQPMTQAGTIAAIGEEPLGHALLVLVAAGLAGYAAWGAVRVVYDPQRRGHGPGGILLRIGYGTSAIAYLGMLYATLRILNAGRAHGANHPDWIAQVLAHPFGAVIVAVIGLCWIFGSGIAQIVMGWHRTFERDLALERLGGVERAWAIGLGRVGLVSRGFVFTIIGVLLVTAAFHASSHSNAGLDGALLELARQPFGRLLLGATGLGLMTFGIYSAMCARWTRMRRPAGVAVPPSPHAPREESRP